MTVDNGAWDLAKLAIAALLGGGVSAYLQRILPRETMRVALKADARGALRFAQVHIPQFDAAVGHATAIERALRAGENVSFDQLTALTEGWVLTAPSPDLLGHGQRFSEDEADAVMKYLNYWNTLVGLEERYRLALERLLEALPIGETSTGAPRVPPSVLREYVVRVRENARELGRQARHLRAQAAHFHDGRIQALTPEEEEKAQQPDTIARG